MTWDGKIRATYSVSFDFEFSDFGPLQVDSADQAIAVARLRFAERIGGNLMGIAKEIELEILEE